VTTFRLAHLSDFHLAPPPIRWRARDLASKRLLSLASWRRKRGHAHRPEILSAIIDDIVAYGPDHVAVTGDLTNFSTPEEFAAAQSWLGRLGPSAAVTVSPGNHDALVARGLAERFAAWRPWLGDDGPDPAPFPQVRARDGVAIVNLSSAEATAPLLARGRLGPAQIERLSHALDDLGRRGLFRVVMLHHPPIARVVASRKALVDQGELRQALAGHGAELVLHGHTHEATVGSLPGPVRPIPVLCVPSASAAPDSHAQPARWHAVEIDPADFAVRVIARGFAPGTEAIEELGRYQLV
jgi:3',5'-cyclic AMP phosphodiesterase CpdA